MRVRRGHGQAAQSLVEFSLLMPVLVLAIWGCIDFGRWEQVRVGVSNAVRVATRYAVVHPINWDYSATAAAASIEGELQTIAVGATIVNDDAHVSIQYYDAGPSTPVYCGSFSVTQRGFVAASGYSQSTCVIPGSIIKVSVTYTYTPSTPGISRLTGPVTLTDTAQMVEEQ